MSHNYLLIFTLAIILIIFGFLNSESSELPPPELAHTSFILPPKKDRFVVFISDLHMGIGRQSDNAWHPTEDFRWPGALSGMLHEISNLAGDNIDLAIVGDFLELWQPTDQLQCVGPKPELGCTISEMKAVVESIIKSHKSSMLALRGFSERGENRLHIIPGNHDSALILKEVWQPLGSVLGSESGRVNLVTDGVWNSMDGRIVAEHGHQIGSDANKYVDWPQIVHQDKNTGSYHITRPWGELFVQRIFNIEELEYSLIDNLSPETAGVKYRILDSGAWKSTWDIARFLYFNLWETSLNQKAAFLGPQEGEEEFPLWNLRVARELGYKLFSGALEVGDPFRQVLLENSSESIALREELTSLSKDKTRLSDDEVRLLCDLVAIRGTEPRCEEPTLGDILESNLIPRKWVLKSHIREIIKKYPMITMFIYGHTHKYEQRWSLDVSSLDIVDILNTGAFQRLIEDSDFRKLAKKMNLEPQKALRKLSVDNLKPCYTVVFVKYEDGLPEPETKAWYMPEGGKGRFVNIESCDYIE